MLVEGESNDLFESEPLNVATDLRFKILSTILGATFVVKGEGSWNATLRWAFLQTLVAVQIRLVDPPHLDVVIVPDHLGIMQGWVIIGPKLYCAKRHHAAVWTDKVKWRYDSYIP